tara:strand:- start:19216 stop:21570 length:2355 start_codon:yes stop_codon:yes gene_type:complete
MSVIVGRALPDARDGLKPVQRRILYAMHELGLSPERPFRKCARVVGDVLGKYHPHGDQAVYDALVRLIQDFSCRYPILDGHGNFGSIDDDPPAAMRYTETRLAPIANETLLQDIDSNTVNYSVNFDGSQQEPNVLPSQLPFLLLNGSSGIAVGMATNIPPHNLNEVIDSVIAMIKKPDISDKELFNFIKGPDFPTGGEIIKNNSFEELYLNGRGSIPMKGIAHIEEINPGRGKHKRNGIIITELPYQISKSGWIEKLAEQVNNGKITGISDIRDESDRDGMRIIVELRRDAEPRLILNNLFEKTQLKCNFGAIFLALVNGKPIQLSLKNYLKHFINFREETVRKKTVHKLDKTIERLEILEGLIIAKDNISSIVADIQKSDNVSHAKEILSTKYKLTINQADGILSMPLKKLTSLEQKNISEEYKKLSMERKRFESILSDKSILLNEIIIELKALKKKFYSKRKTQITEEIINLEDNISSEEQKKKLLGRIHSMHKLLILENNFCKFINQNIYDSIKKDINSEKQTTSIEIKKIIDMNYNLRLIGGTKDGKIFNIKWGRLNVEGDQIEKVSPNNIHGIDIVKYLPLNNQDSQIGLLSNDGGFKKVIIEDIKDMSNRSISVCKLRENSKIIDIVECKSMQDLVILTSIGRILRFDLSDNNLPPLSRLALGPILVRLLPWERIINCETIMKSSKETLIMITKKGLIIKLNSNKIKETKRGELGIIIEEQKSKKDTFIKLYKSDQIAEILTSKDKRIRIIANIENNKEKIILDKDEYIKKVNNYKEL